MVYVPTPIAQQSPDDNAYNPISTLDVAPMTVPINSEANLYSGEVTENYQLQSYHSLGVNQSFQLSYSSRRANSERTIPFEYRAFAGSNNRGLFAKLLLEAGPFTIVTSKRWELAASPVSVPVQAAIKLDTSTLASGIYQYDLAVGLNGLGNLNSESQNRPRGELIHVNSQVMPFGAGWGLAGLQQVVVNNQGFANETLLLIDGSGNEQKFTVIKRLGGVTEYSTLYGQVANITRTIVGGVATFERRSLDGTAYKFNSDGLLRTVTDRRGNITVYDYDSDNIIKTITDAAGLITTFERSGTRIGKIIDPAGRATELYYDGDGNLSKIKDPDATETKWTYNPKHLIFESTDKLGNTGRDYYDDFGRAIAAERKDGSTVEIISGLNYTSSGLILNSNPQTVTTGLVEIPIPSTVTRTIRSIDASE